MHTAILYLFTLALLCTGCGEDDDSIPRLACGPDIQIVDVLTDSMGDDFDLISTRVTDQCLEVTIAATGCSSQGWKLELLTLGNVTESSPTQTSAQLVFDDGVPPGDFTCQAYITETYFFDLSPYLTPETLPTVLSLTGTETTVPIK